MTELYSISGNTYIYISFAGKDSDSCSILGGWTCECPHLKGLSRTSSCFRCWIISWKHRRESSSCCFMHVNWMNEMAQNDCLRVTQLRPVRQHRSTEGWNGTANLNSICFFSQSDITRLIIRPYLDNLWTNLLPWRFNLCRSCNNIRPQTGTQDGVQQNPSAAPEGKPARMQQFLQSSNPLCTHAPLKCGREMDAVPPTAALKSYL